MPEIDSSVSRTVVGILHAVRCDVPIDVTLLKNMHNGSGNIVQRSMKPRPAANNPDTQFCSHMWQVNEVLNKMKVKLIPIWDFDRGDQNFRVDKEGNDEGFRDLVGFSVVNDVVDKGFVENEIEKLIINDKQDGKQNSKEHHAVFEELQNEVDRMKLSGLISENDSERSLNHFLKQIILAFIVTRAYELKDQAIFLKKMKKKIQ